MKDTIEVSSTFAEVVPAAGSSIPSTCSQHPSSNSHSKTFPQNVLNVTIVMIIKIINTSLNNTSWTNEDIKGVIAKTQGASLILPKGLVKIPQLRMGAALTQLGLSVSFN